LHKVVLLELWSRSIDTLRVGYLAFVFGKTVPAVALGNRPLSRRLRRVTDSTDGPGANPGRVLVTDGEFKHTLGIVRALGARGLEVHLLAGSGRAPAVHSRSVSAWYQAPASGAAGFDERLLEVAGWNAPASFLPVGSGAMASAHRLRDRLPAGLRVALPEPDAFAIANDKHRTAVLASAVGVATLRGVPVADAAAARQAGESLGFPLVLKSVREEGRKVLRYVRSSAEVDQAFCAVSANATGGVLAQEYAAGEGFGFSALYWHGRRVRHCMHRRVREWPPSGGTSACAESLPEAPELERAGTAVLDALRWHGVAMVEFKGSLAPGGLRLMEVNAKFWGSHDVALAAGVDFPGDLVALLEGRELPPQGPVLPVRFAWPLGGDLWHGLFRPSALPRVLWDAVSPGVVRNFRLGDPAPSFWEFVQWVRSAPGAWREQRELRR
jgi:predicted ATP-grasp superfamily ATP-dependent carboligase